MHALRTRIRFAQRLQEIWQQRTEPSGQSPQQWRFIDQAWNSFSAIRNRLRQAEDHGFTHCLPTLWEDCRWRLDELARTLGPLREAHNSLERMPSLSDWVQELRALDDEFGEFKSDIHRSVLRVTTEPITLEGIGLGAFSIELHWARIGEQRGSHCFDVVATEPHPACGRDDVMHPHVNSGDLCAGDAAGPIDRALTEGRISDAFVLIRSVLTTYNPRSAYVQLSEWDGLICGDCGRRADRDTSSYCAGCESDLCDGCALCCRSCDETRCTGCLSPCEGCDDDCCSRCLEELTSGKSVCSGCRAICSGCDTAVLQSDLNDDSLCVTCAAEEEPTPTLEESHAS